MPMILDREDVIDIERKSLDLEIKCGYEKAANIILGYLQHGHVWDPRFGWDGVENKLGIHENYVTRICRLLWYEGQIIAYMVDQPVFCSKTQWAQWTACDPSQASRKLEFKQFAQQTLGSW